MTYFEAEKEREPRIAELMNMLIYCRPAGSKTERKFIKNYIMPLGVKMDKSGNLIKRIGTAPILWSAHTDTVHYTGGNQVIAVDKDEIALAAISRSNCLGADNTAGVWLLIEMIKAGKEGLYIFHRGEEKGGIGSKYITTQAKGVVDGIQVAIAFDRRGQTSIITHQRGARRCSETFSKSLAAELGLGHTSDSGGSFTDTCNYSDLIGECTNVSVGFTSEHSQYERLNVPYLEKLRAALLNLDTGKLEVERKPGEVEKTAYSYRGPYNHASYWEEGYYYEGRWHSHAESYAKPREHTVPVNNLPANQMQRIAKATKDIREAATKVDKVAKAGTVTVLHSKPGNLQKVFDLTMPEDDLEGFGDCLTRSERKKRCKDFVTICRQYPDHVADYLEQIGADVEDLLDHIAQIEAIPARFK